MLAPAPPDTTLLYDGTAFHVLEAAACPAAVADLYQLTVLANAAEALAAAPN
jgi:hypothetical protein